MANAAAEAEWPLGKEKVLGARRKVRATGLSGYATGRTRRKIGLITPLLSALLTHNEPIPRNAARRVGPLRVPRMAAMTSQSLPLFAAWDSQVSQRSVGLFGRSCTLVKSCRSSGVFFSASTAVWGTVTIGPASDTIAKTFCLYTSG